MWVTPPRQKNLIDVLQHYIKSIKATNYSSFYFTAILSKTNFGEKSDVTCIVKKDNLIPRIHQTARFKFLHVKWP